jgi:hypothetical protein
VSLETITQLLTDQDFELVEVLEDVDQTGIAWFRQKPN